MMLHLIEGDAGCQFAISHGCTAIVVDALRASATAAMLLHHGATGVLCVREVEEALAARDRIPGALLFGERDGLPPLGFDHGNSPRDAHHALGRPVVFTTTTGAQRLVACWGAPAVYMGTTVNASAVADAARERARDIVIIPAGLAGDPAFDALEDWAAASVIARAIGGEVGEGRARFEELDERIDDEGIEAIFHAAPHAASLAAIGLHEDIAFCARLNETHCVPRATRREGEGVWLEA